MNNNIKILLYLFCSFTLFVGLFFLENSSGGAKIDFNVLTPFMLKFSEGFKEGMYFFVCCHESSIIHSPIFYILVGNLINIFDNFFIIKIIYILLSCTLPYIFYLILKEKYKVDYLIIYLISLLIFLSPYFRSSAIWLLGDNLSLIFFSLAILFYLKGKSTSQSNYFFYCMLSLILCSYIRYYYSIFSIFFLIECFKYLSFKKITRLIGFCIFFSMPGIFYFYYIIVNFNYLGALSSHASINYLNNTIQILSIILFYILPFFVLNIRKVINYYYQNYKIIFIIISTISSIYILNFYLTGQIISTGRGVLSKIVNLINLNDQILLFLISILSLVLIDYIFKNKRFYNYAILFFIIVFLPLQTIFQKYLDPLFVIVLFGLVDSDFLKDFLKLRFKGIILLYSYFLFFLVFSYYYYLSI